MKRINSLGELGLIKEFARRYETSSRTLIGIGDDAAVLSIAKNKLLVFTTDCLIEGTHFTLREATPFQIGWKALGASLSDLAAMGAEPKAAVISLALSGKTTIGFVSGLTKGIKAISKRFAVDIVGGDTIKSPKENFVSVAMIGEVSRKYLCLRSGAKIGDKIVVTGRLGGSRLKKQYDFVPRVKEAGWLVRNSKINAMMDITDGLSLDLFRMITASNVGARLYEEAIPVAAAAYKNSKSPVTAALADGEDFELLFTVPKTRYRQLINKWRYKKLPLTVIGEIIPDKGRLELVMRNNRKKQLKPKGYKHF